MRKALLLALSVMLVAAAVGGATMAWFTDAAVTEPNKFAAGTVDITAGGSLAVSDVIGETKCEIIEEYSYPAFVVAYEQGSGCL